MSSAYFICGVFRRYLSETNSSILKRSNWRFRAATEVLPLVADAASKN
jgi:hypothetical protein